MKSSTLRPSYFPGDRDRARLDLALRAAGMSEWELDLRSGVMSLDARARELLGLAPGVNADRASWLATVALHDKAMLVGQLDALSRAHHDFACEYRLASSEPPGRWVRVAAILATDSDARPTHLYGVAADVTARHVVAERLARTETAPSSVSDDTAVSIARFDRNLRFLYANRAYAKRSGLSPSELVGRSLRATIGEETYAVMSPHIATALLGESAQVDLQWPDVGSRSTRVRAVFSPEFDTNGAITGLIEIDTEQAEPTEAGAARTEDETRIGVLVENSPDVIARLDRAARHLFVNRAVQSLLGITAGELMGRSLGQVNFPDDVAKAYETATAEVFGSGRENTFLFDLTVDGRTLHYKTRAIPEFDRFGAVESVLAITTDVTQATDAQFERDALLIRETAARMQAEAAARVRDEFISIVSHELRSPLNGIQSWTHVLENYVATDSPPVVRALAGIKRGVQQQVRLIEDLLDATLIMTGKLRLIKQPVFLRAQIETALTSLAQAATEKQIVVETHIDQVDPCVEGDSERLMQIVWHLLSNAIKFTPEGGRILVELSAQGQEATISVRDNGRGIAADFLPYLFDPFRQADDTSTRRASGIGLGLTLVRRLTEMHGGRVAAESAGENQGAQFSVSLPLKSAVAEMRTAVRTVKAHPEKILSSLHERRVVLVDDQKEALDSLAELLQQAGAQVLPFVSGREVVDHFRDVSPDERPDVVICDIAMPEQDGYVTLQKIREIERDTRKGNEPPTPAIALTAFSQHEDKIRALAHGFQVHLAKPVDPAELICVIDALTQRETNATPGGE